MKSNWIALLLLAAAFASAQDHTASTHAASDYRIAEPGYTFQFPRDFFNHEDYQTEWWYYTGNVRSADGHRFGYELTFFRQGVSRAESSIPWFVHDVWMAHIALSDINGQQFYSEERLNRSGPGVAGVDEQRGLVWNGNWQAHIGNQTIEQGSAKHEEELHGIADKFALALKLVTAKPAVIQGQGGVSQKAEGNGHASHYFSLTRLITTGSIDLGGKTYQVDGTSWMDHEFFTSSMATDETGWDWLSVQLDDGAELMLYRLRHTNGSIDPYSSGSYVDASGKPQFLSAGDFTMTPAAETWTSAATKAAYPLHWHVSIPRLKMELDVTTPLKSQELTGGFGPSYWEGAVDVNTGHALHGVGYLEMTGYADAGKPIVPR